MKLSVLHYLTHSVRHSLSGVNFFILANNSTVSETFFTKKIELIRSRSGSRYLLDGNSKHVAHVFKKPGLFRRRKIQMRERSGF